MKRLPQTLRSDLGPVLLNRDDLRELFRLLKGNAKTVRIELEGNLMEEEGDLDKVAGKRASEFSATTSAPTVSVSLSRHYAMVSAQDDDLAAAGLFYQATDLLRERKRKRLSPTHNLILPMLFTILASPVAFSSRWLFPDLWSPAGMVWFLAVTTIVGWGWCLYAFRNHQVDVTRIDLRDRVEISGWWERNRDAIVVRVLTGVLLLVVGYLLGRFRR